MWCPIPVRLKTWTCALPLGLLAACGDAPAEDTADSATMGVETLSSTGTGTGSSSTDDPTFDSSTSGSPDTDSTTGSACAEDCGDGVCVDGACCAAEAVCDEICCAGGDVCSFQECVTPGAECVDASECADNEYCEYSLGEPGDKGVGKCGGGVSLATGRCLPEPPECPDGVVPDGEEIDCLPECEIIPEPSFAPELKYHWDLGNSMMAPIIIQLDDDNCDDQVDERDIPEIVFATFETNQYNVNGTLHAISIVDGAIVDKWSANPQDIQINPGRSIASGNIDGVPGNEIVVCLTNGGARAYRADGTELWTSDYVGGCFMPSIADFDQDGIPEVAFQNGIVSGATGVTQATYAGASGASSIVVSDIDGDGTLEVVGPAAAFEADGTQIAATGLGGSHPAVADFDGDGSAEVATIVTANHTLVVWRPDPADPAGADIIRQDININGDLGACSGDTGGGPPTIADFNGDGIPDVGVAAGVGYAVFDGGALLTPAIANETTLLWITPAVDCSSRQTGSSVFDFDGNGQAEVVYADQEYLRIYDGPTGAVLFETCNTTGTLWEYPLVADVDNDGHADIVAISNDYSSITCPDDGSQQRGVRVFGDQEGKWVRTRRIWNQHAYHVTNVEEDGTIPATEVANWTVPRLNNFRQNVQPEGEFSAPDLIASVSQDCSPMAYGVVATVRNIGRAAVPAGVPVTFYAGDPAAGGALLGTMMTTKELYPAEGEDLTLLPETNAQELRDGLVEAWVVVDEGNPVHTWRECRPDNNSASALVPCNISG